LRLPVMAKLWCIEKSRKSWALIEIKKEQHFEQSNDAKLLQ